MKGSPPTTIEQLVQALPPPVLLRSVIGGQVVWERAELFQAIEQIRALMRNPYRTTSKMKRCEWTMPVRLANGYYFFPHKEITRIALQLREMFATHTFLIYDVRFTGYSASFVAQDAWAYQREACRRIAIIFLAAKWTRLCRNVRRMLGRSIWSTRRLYLWNGFDPACEPLPLGVRRLI
jgi:hypothetical protein